MYGENTDLLLVHPNNHTWGTGITRVDSVYLGATFLRDTTKSEFCIWNWSSHGATISYGNLSIFIRGGANNGGDTTIFLFKNTDPDGTKICLQNNPVVRGHIHHLDTIIFKYTWPEPGTPVNIGYSGPNRNPADTAWKAHDYIWSSDTSTHTLTNPAGNTFKVGRRWCAAGWIQSFAGAIKRTDTVQFGFEDNHAQFDNKPLWNRFPVPTDFDFDDVLFKVDGVYSFAHLIPPPLTFKVEPNDTIMAGDTARIIGVLFDQTGKYVPLLSDSVTWAQVRPPIPSGDNVIIFRGDTTRFTSTTAYHTAYIVGKYTGHGIFYDTVKLYVLPAPPCRLVIEPKGPINLNRPNELDTLRILSNESQRSVIATLRDAYGNFVRYSNVLAWGSFDIQVVSVEKGDINFGEGVVTRYPAGTDLMTRIAATDAIVTSLKDSCNVKLEEFYFIQLRIVIGNDTNSADLTMNTNQDTTVIVQGQRSFDAQWVDVSAKWTSSPNLPVVPTAPLNDHTWRFSPSDTGRGWIKVTMTGDVKADSLPVHFTPGPIVGNATGINMPLVIIGFSSSGNVLRYTLPVQCLVILKYYDIRGRQVASFVNQTQDPGRYSLPLPLSTWSRGAYIQVFSAGSFVKKDRVVVAR